MSISDFPDEDAFTASLGLTVLGAEDEHEKYVDLENLTGENATLSYNAINGSVRLIWNSEGRAIVDVFREGVYRLKINDEAERATFEVSYVAGPAQGSLVIQVLPSLSISDRMLLT